MLKPEHRGILNQLSPQNVYLVGGSVRDLLIGREANDVDLTVVGDACELAKRFAAATGGECTLHERFGTATVATDAGNIDLVTARRERYPTPGALPEIEASTLEDDLLRRDFTVNAMAMSLEDNTLTDNHGGRADLDAGLIRPLHTYSFYEDPTRIFRATRYSVRLNFMIPELTQFRMMYAAGNGALDTVSGDRIRRELEKATLESNPLPIFQSMNALGLFGAIAPGWTPDFSDVPPDWKPQPLGWMAIAMLNCHPRTTEALVERLNMSKEWSDGIRTGISVLQALAGLSDASRPSEVCTALDPSSEVLESMDAGKVAPRAANAISKYISEWRHVRPGLNGRDLMTMGVHEGPELGRLTQNLRNLRLDQPRASREDEEALVKRWLEVSRPT